MTDTARIEILPAPDGTPLRIALVAPPLERVPPLGYGGTERIIHALAVELAARGHAVTLFASGDSEAPGELVATVPAALRPQGYGDDPSPFYLRTLDLVVERAPTFDLIHSHLEWWSLPLARAVTTPVVSTFHRRLDQPGSRSLLEEPPDGLVAISASQASAHPGVPWTVVHNGLDLRAAPFRTERSDGLAFVGRVDPEKGIVDAIEVAKRTGRPLRIAAKVGTLARERDYAENVFRPALAAAGSLVEYLGEIAPAERDELFASSDATLMPGSWPEPFGLVAIESLACGTPILARRVGGLPEVIREGLDGWFGDDVTHLAFLLPRIAELDRTAIRASVLDRFSAARMAATYEALYRRRIAASMAGSTREAARAAR